MLVDNTNSMIYSICKEVLFMKHIKKILCLGIVMCFMCSFLSYAGEGMTKVGGDDNSAVLQYINEDNTYLKNQWKQVWDNWYYFGEDGKSIQSAWAEIDGKWYYFDQWSIMLHDTITPDGYSLGADGAMIENSTDQINTVTETQPATEAQNEASKTNTYYWTPGGKSYHASEDCTTLKRSKTILSGTLDEARGAGKNDPCNVCVK